MGRIPNKLYHWKPSHGKRKPDRPKTSWREVIQKDINKMDLGLTVEAEVAERKSIMWRRHLSSQAVSAVMHDHHHHHHHHSAAEQATTSFLQLQRSWAMADS